MTRYRRHLMALIAGCTVIAGCSSGVDPSGTTTAGATTRATTSAMASIGSVITPPAVSSPVTNPAGSAASSPAAPPGASSADPGSSAAAAGSTVVPAELDAQSAAWFEAVCGKMNVDLPTGEGDLSPQVTVDHVKSLSAAMVATGQIAATLPPPTIDGGAELAVALAVSMSSSGLELEAKVDSYLAEMDGANPYSAESAVLTSRMSLRTAFEPLIGLDPPVKAALGQFPACQTYGF